MPIRQPRQHSQEVFTDGADGGISISFGDSPSIDAFGRQRIANPTSLIDVSFEYGLQPLLWEMSTTGTGSVSHDADKRVATLAVGAGAGVVKAQTYAYLPYQKGKSQRILSTFILGARASGIRRRVGYFDDSDGLFFEQTNAGLFLVLRSSTTGTVVDTRYAQTDWSEDPLNGTGDSEITLDETRRQILDVDFEWLGVGRVRFGFNIDGATYFAHFINNANAGAALPYMRSGTLPLRFEIENTGSGGAADLLAVCASVISEGGFEADRGIPFSANMGVTSTSVSTRRPVMTIRPKATFNSLENRGQITPIDLNIFTQTQNVLVELVYNGLLFTGTSFTSVDDQSMTEYDTGATIVSGGYVIQSFIVPTTGTGGNARGSDKSPILSRLPLTLDLAGANPIPLSVVCTALTGTAAVLATINWDELK